MCLGKVFSPGRTALVISLLLPAAVSLADAPPQVLLFAPGWLDRNRASLAELSGVQPTPAKHIYPTIPVSQVKKLMKPANQVQKTDATCRTSERMREAASGSKDIASERDGLIEELNELQAQLKSRQQASVAPISNTSNSGMSQALAEARKANILLKKKYDSLKSMVDVALGVSERARRELEMTHTENVHLKIENKTHVLQQDIALAQLDALRSKLNVYHQSQHNPMKGKTEENVVSVDKGKHDDHVQGNAQYITERAAAPMNQDPQTFSAVQPDAPHGNNEEGTSGKLIPLTGDYAAGVALGREALKAIDMNRMLGVQTRMESFYNGVSDALKKKVRFSHEALNNAQLSLSRQVQQAREGMLKEQAEAGKKALTVFRKGGSAIKDAQGYWYKIDSSDGGKLEAGRDIRVTVKASLAGGREVEDDHMVLKEVAEFPPLFRNVISLLGKKGNATFFVPPELAYGDDGLPPSIPPGASLIYRVTIEQDKTEAASTTDKITKAGKAYLKSFLLRKGVKKSDLGFWYEIKEKGTGAALNPDNSVTIVMRESIAGGRVIKDMVADKQAITLRLDRYPPLFRRMLTLLRNKGAVRMVVPSQLAYGNEDLPSEIPQGSLIIYDIRVLEIRR